jgi:uncharacterized protein (TIGR03437 family)
MQQPGSAQSILIRRVLVLAVLVCLSGSLLAQQARIAGKINGSQRYRLTGHLHPNAISQYDQGQADASLELRHVTLVLKPSESQQADLDQLLAEQQDSTSKNYHKWLSPEAYADRFGASQDDINKMVEWLQSQSLTVTSVARARNAVAVSGTAAQIGSAFETQIHKYQVDGETHYANSTEPSVPAAMQGVVQGIGGLHDFRLKAKSRNRTMLGVPPDAMSPNNTSSSTGNHYLAPDDFVTVFNIRSLYNAGIDGSGQKIVIVGQSRIDTSHLATFRSYFGLPAADLTTTLVPNTRDPGIISGDAQESDLDLEWASGVARGASLIFVYSYNVSDAVQYAIDQNLAPIVSMSYGECEISATKSDALTWQTWAKQGNAQGITWVAASGDSGAADCYQSGSGRFGPNSSNLILATDLPASIPEVTGVGGTTLNEGTGTFWNGSNDATTKASVRSYIPETAWNDSAADGTPAASGGGASTFFLKPSWQTGTGVPSDGARDVPDVAFPASADHDGYMVYTTSGRQTTWYIFGGTSAGAPTFSGILALLNHYLVANGYQSGGGLGNINTRLYQLAASAPSAFHDITTGDNVVSATACVGFRCSSASTVSVGYSTTTGYDQVTGLGSIDAYNFVTAWHLGSLLAKSQPAVALAADPTSISVSGSATLTATFTSSDSGTPTGTVTFSVGSTTLGVGNLSGSSGTATASLTVSGGATGLSFGVNTITAVYSGDSSHNPATASTSLAITGVAPLTPSISGATNAASYQQSYAPGMVMSIFGTQLASTTNTGNTPPLPTVLDSVSVTVNGVTAPLYYISPTQLNVQLPYETPTSGKVTLVVGNHGQSASTTIQMSAVAPGIFFDSSSGALVPTAAAKRGQTITLYMTGAGAVEPFVATGATPGSGATPVPALETLVTVGGVAAVTTYIGVPSWSVGVLQINFLVPATAALGSQPIVVSVGGVASAAATLAVSQ